MKKKATLAVAAVVATIMVIFAVLAAGNSASAVDGGYSHDPANPTLVTEVPEGFAPYGDPTTTVDNCITSVTQEYSRTTPGSDAQTHNEWRTEERTRTADEFPDYTMQYHFRKFTHTKTRTWVEGTPAVDHWWNWSPNDTQGPQDYVPDFPNDSRGTWQGPHVNGGPQQDTYGTFQTGGGNSPYFHREHISDEVPGHWGDWSDYGPWTPWEPMTHESWEDSNTPLGVPQFHGQGQDGNTQWYREWQAQWDGTTRMVQTGTHIVYGEWGPWTSRSEHDLTDPVLPQDTDTHEYRKFGPVVVVDVPSSEDVVEYVYTVTKTGEACSTPTPTPTPTPPPSEPPVTPNPPAPNPPAPVPPAPKPPHEPKVPTLIDSGL